MENNSPFVSLLLITLLALIVPFLANRIKIVMVPFVVGEILAGIIIGKIGLNLVEPTPTLNFLSEFGFAMLMFLSVLEVNFEMLRSSSGTSKKIPSGCASIFNGTAQHLYWMSEEPKRLQNLMP